MINRRCLSRGINFSACSYSRVGKGVTVSKNFLNFAAVTTEESLTIQQEGGMGRNWKTVPLMPLMLISGCMRRPSGPLK